MAQDTTWSRDCGSNPHRATNSKLKVMIIKVGDKLTRREGSLKNFKDNDFIVSKIEVVYRDTALVYFSGINAPFGANNIRSCMILTSPNLIFITEKGVIVNMYTSGTFLTPEECMEFMGELAEATLYYTD